MICILINETTNALNVLGFDELANMDLVVVELVIPRAGSPSTGSLTIVRNVLRRLRSSATTDQCGMRCNTANDTTHQPRIQHHLRYHLRTPNSHPDHSPTLMNRPSHRAERTIIPKEEGLSMYIIGADLERHSPDDNVTLTHHPHEATFDVLVSRSILYLSDFRFRIAISGDGLLDREGLCTVSTRRR